MSTGKTIALTIQNFVGKVRSLLFNMLSRLVITFLPRSKHLLISWLQSIYKIQSSHSARNHTDYLVMLVFIISCNFVLSFISITTIVSQALGWEWRTDKWISRNSLLVQRLGLSTLTTVVPGSIPGQGTKVPQSAWRNQKERGKQVLCCFSKVLLISLGIDLWDQVDEKDR